MAEGTRFRLYPQAPVSEAFAEPEVAIVSSPAGSLSAGPADHRMYALFPIGKQEPYGIAPEGGDDVPMPPWEGEIHPPPEPDADGHFDHLEPGTPQFECAHLFGTVRFVLDVWEGYFGREIPWHSARHYERIELSMLPALQNAYSGYGFIEVGSNLRDGQYKPYSLNFDVIAHEVGHALIYSVIGIPDPGTARGEYFGFHESAADLVAMLSSLHFDSLVDDLLETTSGNLYMFNAINRMAELSANEQIRIAANDVRLRAFARGWVKEHQLSQPLTGAFFDIFVDIFHELLLEDGLITPEVEDLSDQLYDSPDYAEIMQAHFDEAFAANPDGFRAELLEARDVLGLYLAETWQRLDPDRLDFVAVAEAFLDVDAEHGGRFQRLAYGNFKMRDIGDVAVGPQLEPLGADSHAASARTVMPVD